MFEKGMQCPTAVLLPPSGDLHCMENVMGTDMDDIPDSANARSDTLTTEFVRLLKQHERQINGYIMALVSDWQIVDEIAQETSIRLWNEFHQYRRDMDFGVWARTIARYEVLSYQKRLKRDRLRFSPEFVDTVASRWEKLGPDLTGQLDALKDCTARLTDEQYKLIRLCYRGDRTIRQVAEFLGRTYQATYKALERTRKVLHDCILKKTRDEEST
jgi:RNA polymerase sigma-70 factor (ECF subfamily)